MGVEIWQDNISYMLGNFLLYMTLFMVSYFALRWLGLYRLSSKQVIGCSKESFSWFSVSLALFLSYLFGSLGLILR